MAITPVIRHYPGVYPVNPIGVRTEHIIPDAMRANLVGEYVFGYNATFSGINMADPTKPLLFAGNPTFAARYVTLDQTRWADTGLYDSQELTLVEICTVDTSTAPLITNFTGANTADTTHLSMGATQMAAIVCDSTGTQQTPSQSYNAHAPKTDFSVKMLRTTGSVNFTVKNSEFRTGALVGTSTKVTAATRKVSASAAFAIGSCRGGSSFAGTSRVAAAAIFTRCLSDAEALALAASLSDTMAAWPQGPIVC
jgi:hypothetical protein